MATRDSGLTDEHVRREPPVDEASNVDLVHCWYGRVYALCQSKLWSRADAEDAAQETFLRGLTGLDRLRDSTAIGPWLRGIASHVCVDFVRQNHRRNTTDAISLAPTEPTDDVAQRDEQAYLIELVRQLPEQYRETLLLHYYEEMTYDEIADWLGVARSTVNDRLSKARNLLKRQLLSRRCIDEV